MSTSGGGSGAEITHCEWCGAEYPGEAPGPGREPPRRPAPAPGTGRGPEPGTHCEWCGAEYPVPGEDA